MDGRSHTLDTATGVLMSHDRLNIALVGAAGLVAAPAHLNAIPTIDRLNLVALCDVNADAVQALADERGVGKAYSSYDELLADPEIDAVDLVTPPFMHAEMAIAAVQAGKHVYVEKPMARSLGEARAMVQAAADADVRLMVGESYVFHGPHLVARNLIEADAIGEVVQVRQTRGPWLFNEAENERLGGRGHHIAWRYDPTLSGGGDFPWMMDHGPHFFATARLFNGMSAIERVNALPRPHGEGREEHLRGITAVTWMYEGGEVDGVWMQGDTVPEAGRYVGFRTEIVGAHGTILVFGEGGGSAPGYSQIAPVTLYADGTERTFDPGEGSDRSWASNNSYYDRAHGNALRNFAYTVLDGMRARYAPEDGVADLAATLATIKSAMDGRPVALADVPDEWTAYGAG
ncbi:MAG: Gfo/Idh/MocA family oxidoreductase [Chloroflexi bacterium]|nr:Gfo/Idh/MocA family oxidoreductase [Chloroflexota bacterium]